MHVIYKLSVTSVLKPQWWKLLFSIAWQAKVFIMNCSVGLYSDHLQQFSSMGDKMGLCTLAYFSLNMLSPYWWPHVARGSHHPGLWCWWSWRTSSPRGWGYTPRWGYREWYSSWWWTQCTRWWHHSRGWCDKAWWWHRWRHLRGGAYFSCLICSSYKTSQYNLALQLLWTDQLFMI